MPMPAYLVILVGSGILGIIGVAAAVIYWNKIVKWVESSLFPWFEKHLPTIAPLVKKAFSQIDNVAVGTRQIAKNAWLKLRQYLPTIEVEFERTGNKWSMRTTAYIVKNPEQNQPILTQNTTTQEISWDELPKNVREAWLNNRRQHYKHDFTEIRDKEILEMTQ